MSPTVEAHAAAEVCAIPELLENILIYVDPFQLFTLQSVNSTFQDLIQNTKSLRMKMCLEPSSDRVEVEGLMQEERIKAVTRPFDICFFYYRGVHWFDFELQCGQLQTKDPDHSLPPGSGSRDNGIGTWRQIKIGDPRGRVIHGDLSCPLDAIMENVIEVDSSDNLGKVLDEMTAVVQKGWTKIHDWCYNH